MCQTEIVGVGISAMGPIDMEKGRILSPTHFFGIENYDVVNEVKKFTDLPVYLYKNTNCALPQGAWRESLRQRKDGAHRHG